MLNLESSVGGIVILIIFCFFIFFLFVKDSFLIEFFVFQDVIIEECFFFFINFFNVYVYVNMYGILYLDCFCYVVFLYKQFGKFLFQFKVVDLSWLWFFYWCLVVLVIFGEDVEEYCLKFVGIVWFMQNEGGGFVGGFGQMLYFVIFYVIVLVLMFVGGDEVYEVVDWRVMWRWLSFLKQLDGGFQMVIGGEEDVRYVFFLCLS